MDNVQTIIKEKVTAKKILLVCDNRHTINWGCRGTSLALIYILENSGYQVNSLSEILGQRDSISRISGLPFIKTQNDTKVNPNTLKMIKILEKILEKIFGYELARNVTDIRTLDLLLAVKRLKQLSKKNVICKQIIDAVANTDIVCINGEGSPIFTNPPRFDLLFQMMMIQLGKDFGKNVAYVNAIISSCPIHGIHQPTVETFAIAINGISLVTVRDKESLKMSAELNLSPKKLVFCPDALFAISSHLLGEYQSLDQKIIYSSYFTSYTEPRINKIPDLKSHQYLCLSGASAPPRVSKKKWGTWFYNLLNRLQNDIGLPIVVVQPCDGDQFLYDVSKELNLIFIPSSTSIYWGAKILSHSAAYISGRYHPSIMASFGGTPQIMLESNSHKTLSLQQLLGESFPQVFPIAQKEKTIDLIIEATKKALDGVQENREKRLITVNNLTQQSLTLGQLMTLC